MAKNEKRSKKVPKKAAKKAAKKTNKGKSSNVRRPSASRKRKLSSVSRKKKGRKIQKTGSSAKQARNKLSRVRRKTKKVKRAKRLTEKEVFARYEKLNLPLDLKQYLKSLYKRRKKAAGRKKFRIPTASDAVTFSKVENNSASPSYELYWNVPGEISKYSGSEYKIINYIDRVEYKGYNETKATDSINDMNRYIDEIRRGPQKTTFFAMVPVILYRRKFFREKGKKVFRIDIDYGRIKISQNDKIELIELFKS